MRPVQNVHVDQLDDVINEEFKMINVSQVISARDSIFREMQQELNVSRDLHIRQCHFNKRTVSKEKLAEWLETVCYILDSFSSPLLKNAVRAIDRGTERIDELQKLRIEDQKTIIGLQEEVIKKRGNELNEVKTTVQTEMKSYSAMVKKSCPTTLTKKTIEAAVKSACDQEDRSKNVIIYGIEENSGEVLQDKVETVLEQMDEKPVVKDCVRVGVKRPGDSRPRPVKFSLRNSDHVAQVLRSAKKLHTKVGYKSVYVCPDRTVQERKSYKILLDQLKEKRKSEPKRTHFIRNNRIVSSDMNSNSSDGETAKS